MLSYEHKNTMVNAKSMSFILLSTHVEALGRFEKMTDSRRCGLLESWVLFLLDVLLVWHRKTGRLSSSPHPKHG